MSAKYSFLLSFGSLLFVVGGFAQTLEPGVVNFEVDGTRISVPYFDDASCEVLPERREFETKALEEMYTILTELSTDIVINKKSYIGLSPYLVRIHKYVVGTREKLYDLNARGFGPQITTAFRQSTNSLYSDVIAKVDRRAMKSWKNLPAEVFNEKFKSLLRLLIIETPLRSPVGVYLDWKKLTVDDVPLTEIVPLYTNYLRYNCAALTFFEAILGLVSKFTGG